MVSDKLADVVKNIVDPEQINHLNSVLLASCDTMIPLLRKYLEEVRSIRMAFAREVQDILRSTRELNELAETGPRLKELAINIEILTVVLNKPDVQKLIKFFAEGGKN